MALRSARRSSATAPEAATAAHLAPSRPPFVRGLARPAGLRASRDALAGAEEDPELLQGPGATSLASLRGAWAPRITLLAALVPFLAVRPPHVALHPPQDARRWRRVAVLEATMAASCGTMAAPLDESARIHHVLAPCWHKVASTFAHPAPHVTIASDDAHWLAPMRLLMAPMLWLSAGHEPTDPPRARFSPDKGAFQAPRHAASAPLSSKKPPSSHKKPPSSGKQAPIGRLDARSSSCHAPREATPPSIAGSGTPPPMMSAPSSAKQPPRDPMATEPGTRPWPTKTTT
jgi:hypothetical protein